MILWSFLNLFSYEKVFPKKLVVGFDYFCLNKYDTFLKLNYYILLVLLVFSCKKEDNLQQEKKIEKSEFSVNTKHSKILPIKDIFKKEVESWEELNSIETFLDRFKNISVNEALGSASDLTELAKSLKDSVIPNKFDKTSFKARVNIFYNETLRLADIYTIEDITIKEASDQIEKVIATYSAINTKINSILEEERLERLIDINLEKVALDTTKIDAITKKTLNKRRERSVNADRKINK